MASKFLFLLRTDFLSISQIQPTPSYHLAISTAWIFLPSLLSPLTRPNSSFGFDMVILFCSLQLHSLINVSLKIVCIELYVSEIKFYKSFYDLYFIFNIMFEGSIHVAECIICSFLLLCNILHFLKIHSKINELQGCFQSGVVMNYE